VILDKKIILGSEENPLMVLEKHKINPEDFNFKAAQRELLRHEEQKAEHYTWGYFPQYEANPEEYPECVKLSERISSKFLYLEVLDWKMAFVRVSSKEPKSDFGGIHIDVDIGVAHTKNPNFKGKEIARMLINPYHYPRKLIYCKLTTKQLEKRNVKINRDNYEIINIPEELVDSGMDLLACVLFLYL